MKYWYLYFFIFFVLIFQFSTNRKITKTIRNVYGQQKSTRKLFLKYRRATISHVIFLSLSWICLVTAIGKPSWGTEAVPVQRSGNAVSFVFDISNSMNATDVNQQFGKTRLQTSARYSDIILSHLSDVEVSIVICKGDAVVAVPLTSDFSAIHTLTSSLTPELMSAPGTNLAAGINCAVKSFPPQTAKYSTIVVFTDGGNANASLEKAVYDAARYGISIVFAGFGTEQGTTVLSGDKQTYVKTSLEKDTLEKIMQNVRKKFPLNKTAVTYIDALEQGSATKIISIITGNEKNTTTSERTGYEIRNVERQNLFIILSILFLCLDILFSEFSFTHIQTKKSNDTKKTISILLCTISLPIVFSITSCSNTGQEKNNAAYKILKGTFFYHTREYQKSTAAFLQSIESGNEATLPYAQFGLACSYMMLGENESTLEKLKSITEASDFENMPQQFKYSTFYNLGIAEYFKGNYPEAVSQFKNAINCDRTKIEAKINYEISCSQIVAAVSNSQNVSQLSENENANSKSAQNAIFSIIKEDEQKRWKSFQQESTTNPNDY